MAENEEIDRLKRRLSWEGAGPLAELSNQATDALTARGRAFVSWVREMGEERPLRNAAGSAPFRAAEHARQGRETNYGKGDPSGCSARGSLSPA